MKRLSAILLLTVLVLNQTSAQTSLVNTQGSSYAKLTGVGMSDVQWTKGFWAERFAVCRDAMLPQLWQTYTSKDICYSFQNFRVAAGLDTGRFRGPSFHDGDFYKTLEAVAAMYATTKDPQLEKWMDEAIDVIGKAQKTDGYIYTKNIIEQKKSGKEKMFDDQLSFEAYNFGHLMTAACVHYRATGKATLLNIAKKAADFLIGFYSSASPELARNAICPSHYMGLTELYRTTNDKKYLDLVIHLINIRGTVEGTDDNSDRAPFREMNKVVGHAVRANYLFAGVADVYAETGDVTLMNTLNKMWNNVINTKMYVTGGCGALYDGVSVDGTAYKPDTVQKVHQSYGRDYQLPNFSAHNETCANIGNVLWNWRMFLLTGESKYADIVELTLYNSVLSGVSMDGSKYFYTNPLAATTNYPYHLRWEGGRVPYISKSNCCPPNVVRTIAEVNSYMYSIGEKGLYINMYGGNTLATELHDGTKIKLEQTTNYPWDGKIVITIKEATDKPVNIFLRIPGWSKAYTLKINNTFPKVRDRDGGFVIAGRKWSAGDKIELVFDMPATLIESNPLVEETRNQVTVKRGPVVYCLESSDLPQQKVFDVVIPSNIKLQPVAMKIDNGNVMALTGEARLLDQNQWNNTLYKEVNTKLKPVDIKLIPYYAWANRGKTDMTVWLPLMR
ncbi:glycoside hydrolase family 127 protein [Lacibacter sp. H375]|uniref:aceric acid hydrolase n=1 Tax=Lacibacter sp. H375 TaxID=3133424 RepID=UPI0030C2FAF2